jgi:hypothetical protein
MATFKIPMHPDTEVEVARPAELLLTDPSQFEVISVSRIEPPPEEELAPNDLDYPFVPDDANTSHVGRAEDKGGANPAERFRKQMPKLKGQPNDQLKGKKYRLKWIGVPPGDGPHFKVFP